MKVKLIFSIKTVYIIDLSIVIIGRCLFVKYIEKSTPLPHIMRITVYSKHWNNHRVTHAGVAVGHEGSDCIFGSSSLPTAICGLKIQHKKVIGLQNLDAEHMQMAL
jgi:hypothetical protein